MKTTTRTMVLAFLLSMAFVGTTVVAASMLSIQAVAQSAASSKGQVRVTVRNGVATVFGHVDDSLSKHQVLRAVKAYPGVDRVINLIVGD